MKNPIVNGVGLLIICFTAFTSLAAMDYEEIRIEAINQASNVEYNQVQEVRKDNKKTPKICVKKLENQQKAIANKLREIRKDLNKLKK
tara:strand:- start:1741 stop:2004 length:264 start_codon:yes stop_codon:yes gene_type:complete